ncbi:hypothetical protein [Arthrobacter sp. YC-RL1]|uniref:hypothetical protein n=1 Tax=Arthrobacter sp. YC-RL1 TaxID=1652545 RepID=UPI00128CA314|nr:hypothetical protein [Arthrobacter sp. YC-RL1]
METKIANHPRDHHPESWINPSQVENTDHRKAARDEEWDKNTVSDDAHGRFGVDKLANNCHPIIKSPAPARGERATQ